MNILRTKRTFELKQKAFFITFKVHSVVKNCLRPERAPLSNSIFWNILPCKRYLASNWKLLFLSHRLICWLTINADKNQQGHNLNKGSTRVQLKFINEWRRINNLFCSCFDLLYLILFILIFWLRNLYQQTEFEILITLLCFSFGNFIELAKKIQKLRKLLTLFIKVTKIKYT